VKLAVISCAALALAGAAAAPGQTNSGPGRYTLDDCIRIGLRTGGTAALARYDQAIAAAGVAQARAGVMPQVSMQGAYRRPDEVVNLQVGPFEIVTAAEDSYSAGVHISQALYPGAASRAGLRAAKHGATAADWGRADAEQRLIRDISIGFHDVLAAEVALDVRKESVVQAGLLLRETRGKFEQGTASEFDALRAKVDFSNESRSLMRAKNACEAARAGFARMLNLDGGAFELDGALEVGPAAETELDAMQRWAVANRPAMRAAEAALAAARDDLAATRASRMPGLAATLDYNWGQEMTPVGLGADYAWHWTAGLAAQWNFWDGGMTSAGIRRKLLEVEKARVELEELAKTTALEVRLTHLEMRNARDSLAGRDDDVKLAEKSLSIAESRYRTGSATYLDFAAANLALGTARLMRCQATRDCLAAEARLRYACGVGRGPLPGEGKRP
jgi:outer membrane protein TolC